MQLPDVYTIQKFHQLAGYPKQKQHGRVHEAGCEAREYDVLPDDITEERQKYIAKKESNSLPDDSINILDDTQRSYHSGNETFDQVYSFTRGRKLLDACNRPKTLWVSLNDYIHKNRLR